MVLIMQRLCTNCCLSILNLTYTFYQEEILIGVFLKYLSSTNEQHFMKKKSLLIFKRSI